jgi:hypothetical protein
MPSDVDIVWPALKEIGPPSWDGRPRLAGIRVVFNSDFQQLIERGP